jgi:hypothetical protein
MKDVAADIERILDETVPRLASFGEAESASIRPGGAWSRKQILGHLVDSATNNHQRFVRAQLQQELVFPSYEQEGWVRVQGYAERPWKALVELWDSLNRHVAHVVSRIPEDRLATPVRLGEGQPVTLEFVARDYVRHLRHHLEQILEPEEAAGKKYRSFAEP